MTQKNARNFSPVVLIKLTFDRASSGCYVRTDVSVTSDIFYSGCWARTRVSSDLTWAKTNPKPTRPANWGLVKNMFRSNRPKPDLAQTWSTLGYLRVNLTRT